MTQDTAYWSSSYEPKLDDWAAAFAPLYPLPPKEPALAAALEALSPPPYPALKECALALALLNAGCRKFKINGSEFYFELVECVNVELRIKLTIATVSAVEAICIRSRIATAESTSSVVRRATVKSLACG